MSVENPPAPTLAALHRARAQRDATLRRSRPLWLVFIAYVFVTAVRTQPGPGLHGGALGISAALGGLAVAAAGGLAAVAVPGLRDSRGASDKMTRAFVALLFVSSVTLMWLQPNGPAIFGVISAVAVAARLAKGLRGIALVGLAAVAVAVVYEYSGAHRPGSPVLLAWLGLISVYIAVSSARRIREGDEQAERLLAELEETRAAQVRAAALAERQRLAREMHDVLAHSLSGLVLQLEGARLLAARGPADPQLSGVIDKAHHLARSGLQEARKAIGMLRNDELPGPESIEALVSEFERDSGIPCGFTVTGEQRALNPGTRLALYRVTQEALTNIRKHAHPRRAEVRLGYEPDGVLLTIENVGDEKRPAGPTVPDSGGYGLTGMRERAELLGGTLSAAPTRDGFRVALRVPA